LKQINIIDIIPLLLYFVKRKLNFFDKKKKLFLKMSDQYQTCQSENSKNLL